MAQAQIGSSSITVQYIFLNKLETVFSREENQEKCQDIKKVTCLLPLT